MFRILVPSHGGIYVAGLIKQKRLRGKACCLSLRSFADISMELFFVFGMCRWPIPRLVCVLPAPENEKELDRSFEAWSAKLKEWSAGGKIAGRGIATQKLRVFFLCAQDLSLAECGPKGQWYEVSTIEQSKSCVSPLLGITIFLLSGILPSFITQTAAIYFRDH